MVTESELRKFNFVLYSSFAANPKSFSNGSEVLDSGASIPIIRTLSFLRQILKPRSISTSTVSPSITLIMLISY